MKYLTNYKKFYSIYENTENEGNLSEEDKKALTDSLVDVLKSDKGTGAADQIESAQAEAQAEMEVEAPEIGEGYKYHKRKKTQVVNENFFTDIFKNHTAERAADGFNKMLSALRDNYLSKSEPITVKKDFDSVKAGTVLKPINYEGAKFMSQKDVIKAAWQGTQNWSKTMVVNYEDGIKITYKAEEQEINHIIRLFTDAYERMVRNANVSNTGIQMFVGAGGGTLVSLLILAGLGFGPIGALIGAGIGAVAPLILNKTGVGAKQDSIDEVRIEFGNLTVLLKSICQPVGIDIERLTVTDILEILKPYTE